MLAQSDAGLWRGAVDLTAGLSPLGDEGVWRARRTRVWCRGRFRCAQAGDLIGAQGAAAAGMLGPAEDAGRGPRTIGQADHAECSDGDDSAT